MCAFSAGSDASLADAMEAAATHLITEGKWNPEIMMERRVITFVGLGGNCMTTHGVVFRGFQEQITPADLQAQVDVVVERLFEGEIVNINP